MVFIQCDIVEVTSNNIRDGPYPFRQTQMPTPLLYLLDLCSFSVDDCKPLISINKCSYKFIQVELVHLKRCTVNKKTQLIRTHTHNRLYYPEH